MGRKKRNQRLGEKFYDTGKGEGLKKEVQGVFNIKGGEMGAVRCG